MARKLSKAEQEQRKTAALKHGGAAALERIKSGEPFDGPALEMLEIVLDQLAVDLFSLSGIDRVRVERAAKFEAVARLYDVAALAAAAAGDTEAWERYTKRSGWIGSKAFKALGDVRDDLAVSESTIIDALDAARSARGDGENG